MAIFIRPTIILEQMTNCLTVEWLSDLCMNDTLKGNFDTQNMSDSTMHNDSFSVDGAEDII
jgi:hypothetical protein